MLALALLSVLTFSPDSARLVGEPVEIGSDAPAIRLWLNNNRQFREGEEAQVQVEARDDGYLVVVNYDAAGRIRILFPLEPGDDNFVRGGRRYEIRGRGDRESFVVDREGDGLVYAAVSADPFRFDEFESASNWDYTRLQIDRDSPDPEADISDLLQRISSDRGFDYDVLSYRVYGYRGYQTAYTWYPSYYDDFNCGWWTRPSLFGCRYWPVGGWYYGYNSWYYPYGGYGGYGGGWWYPGRIVYHGNRNWPVVVGRPRRYTIGHRTNSGTIVRPGGRSFNGSLPGGRTPVNNGRGRPGSVRPARPVERRRPRGAFRQPPAGSTGPASRQCEAQCRAGSWHWARAGSGQDGWRSGPRAVSGPPGAPGPSGDPDAERGPLSVRPEPSRRGGPCPSLR